MKKKKTVKFLQGCTCSLTGYTVDRFEEGAVADIPAELADALLSDNSVELYTGDLIGQPEPEPEPEPEPDAPIRIKKR